MTPVRRTLREGSALMVVMALLVLVVNVLKCGTVPSDQMGNEVSETAKLAEKYHAKTEVRLPDGTRCDLVNDEFAIEVEWPHKWAESIGQSLYYASELKKKPAVLFLTRGPEDAKYIRRAKAVAQQHGITLYEEKVP